MIIYGRCVAAEIERTGLIEAGELDEDAAHHDPVPAITKVSAVSITYTSHALEAHYREGLYQKHFGDVTILPKSPFWPSCSTLLCCLWWVFAVLASCSPIRSKSGRMLTDGGFAILSKEPHPTLTEGSDVASDCLRTRNRPRCRCRMKSCGDRSCCRIHIEK